MPPLAMFCVVSLAVFLIGILDATWGRDLSDKKETDEKLAEQWLGELDRYLEKVNYDATTAAWNFNVDLTEEKNKLQMEARLRRSELQKIAYENASRFDWRHFKNPDLVRQFEKLTDLGSFVLTDTDFIQLDSIRSKMQLMYSTAEVCNKPSSTSAPESKNETTCLPQNPDLIRIVATSRDWEEQLWAWKGWREVTGKRMRPLYVEMIQLLNKGAWLNGYQDNGDYWRSMYEMENFPSACEKLWQQVKPLYQQLHAYVRRKLMQSYPQNLHDFPNTRHIPAHLTGNIWAQTWNNILDLVIPFKNSSVIDITDILKDKGFDALRMFREADSFFISLGLPPMPAEFWNHSLIEKPKDGRQVVCHASAWDFFNKRDFRIKQCTDITGEYFVTTHHEMGHVQYYLLYKNQPVVYRRGANPGFHEAVGDVIALSVNTPEHLQKIGLLKETTASYESELNFLMKQALDKVAFLPYGYMIDLWRWDVFNGTATADNYNRNYWKLRCKLQGISPPIPRSEEDFDPGAKFHVADNTPYIRYFVSYIIQFQFHKSLCLAAGHVGPLHKCDIYNSTVAGDKLRRMLSLGSSKPWPEAMQVLTGQRNMDAGPLLEYFRPLQDWLEKENKGHDVSWEDDCPLGTLLSKMATMVPSFAATVLSLAISSLHLMMS